MFVAPFPKAISRAPWIFWISGRRNESCQNQRIPKSSKIVVPIAGPLDFLDFRPPKAAEMRGTPQKQQNRPFPNVRHFPMFAPFPEAISRAPWIFWISGRRKLAAKSSISQCSLLFRKPFPGPVRFSGFPAAESCRNEGNPTKAAKSSISQCSLLFRKPFPGLHFQGPLDFLDFRPPKTAKMRGIPKAAKSSSHFQAPWIFWTSGRRKLPK